MPYLTRSRFNVDNVSLLHPRFQFNSFINQSDIQMSMSAGNAPWSFLTDIPLEIRELIYLASMKDILVQEAGRQPAIPTIQRRFLIRQQPFQSLLRSCSQIHDEIWHLIWSKMQIETYGYLTWELPGSMNAEMKDIKRLLQLAPRYTNTPVNVLVLDCNHNKCKVLMRAGEVDASHIIHPLPPVGPPDTTNVHRRSLEWLRENVGRHIERRREGRKWLAMREEWGLEGWVDLRSRVESADV